MALDRSELLADTTVTGSEWCRAHTAAVDSWLRELYGQAAAGDEPPAALVAIGGYGRRELCPHSDIDVVVIHAKGVDGAAFAKDIWYPIWDSGIHLGHKVLTPVQALALAADDLDTATALLSARCIAGDQTMADHLRDGAVRQWRSQAKRWLTQLSIAVRERHRTRSDVAFAMEPDLKEDRGGLRDAHALLWAHDAQPVLIHDDETALAVAYETLLEARVELQRLTDRATNTIALEDREKLAARLGHPDADALMRAIAEAGRSIGWRSDDGWRRAALALRGPLTRLSKRTVRLAAGVELRNGEVDVTAIAAAQPGAVLRIAAATAQHHAALSRHALAALDAHAQPVAPWTDTDRENLVALLRTGRAGMAVIEALDQARLWSRLVMPEWAAVHARPQHNPYHRYTVDRHLLECVANAAKLHHDAPRPDLLLVGALLHDIGKGQPGDHSEAGTAMARRILDRMGFPREDAEIVVSLVEHHLLLVDTATRRDLDDPTTAERVAATVGDRTVLQLLAALTEADGIATGPSAWTPWRAELVTTLVQHVEHLLEQGAPLPSSGVELSDVIDAVSDDVIAGGDTITISTSDRPGAFSRIAGALALHGLEVVSATAESTQGRALSQFRVHDPLRGDPPWDRVVADVRLALDGRLALDARIDERAARYQRRQHVAASAAQVRFDDDASTRATVIDVHADDAVGVLYRITRALADLDLDIRSAKVQTIGHQIVDAFYVQDRDGKPVTDATFRREISRAVEHALNRTAAR